MWTENPILGFDTETTGVNPAKERLVTCSLVRVTSDGAQSRFWLADPGVPIPAAASAIHGITTDRAQQEGQPITKVLAEISDALVAHLSRGFAAVAFNASYDFTLLEAELGRHGLPTLTERLGGEIFPVVDPYLLDRALDRYRRGKRRLIDLVEHYGVGNNDSFHDAETDVRATLRVLGAIVRKYPQVAKMDLREVVDLQIAANNEFQTFLQSRGRGSGPQEGWPVPR
ncbi:exonuclease domain-containing protein [Actinobaculum suis]|uniref:exonuclease domain-containing protein n=1 Tax=Actinobaculum suis TaxID=1657 RepID=UPI00080A62A0|nr:exonuclease domain-containing protein [Actinobaculum suis]OCA93397.1 DNA polymerase III subunit epsilon [Actinobaculum suis]